MYKQTNMYPSLMSDHTPKQLGVSEARNNLTEVVNEVRLLGKPVILTRRDKPQAVVVSTDFYERAVKALGRDS